MKIVALIFQDSAGAMYNFVYNINKYTRHSATVIHAHPHPYEYPSMIWANGTNTEYVHKLVDEADVVIFCEMYFVPRIFGIDPDKLHREGKVLIAAFGGSGFRLQMHREPNLEYYGKIPGIKWMTTSIDFLEEKPDFTWVPRSIRMEEIREKYDYTKQDPPIVTSSPATQSSLVYAIASDFVQVILQLQAKGYKFQNRLIKNATHTKCLTAKASASIFFGRLNIMWGLSSMEAGAFESAVVTRVPPFVRRKLTEFGFDCPIVDVSTTPEAIRQIGILIDDPKYCREKGLECYDFFKKVHSGPESVKRFLKLVES